MEKEIQKPNSSGVFENPETISIKDKKFKLELHAALGVKGWYYAWNFNRSGGKFFGCGSFPSIFGKPFSSRVDAMSTARDELVLYLRVNCENDPKFLNLVMGAIKGINLYQGDDSVDDVTPAGKDPLEECSEKIKGENKTMNYLERMKEAKTLGEGRIIIAEFETELNRVEKEKNLSPNVGWVDPNYFVGFSTIKPKEWEKYIKKARKDGLSEDDSNELIAMIAQGKDMDDHFKILLESNIDEKVQIEKTAKEEADKLIEEQSPVVSRKLNMAIRVKLSSIERELLTHELVAQLNEKHDLEQKKKTTTSGLNAEIKKCNKQIDKISGKISTGTEERNVDCEWKLNFPAPGRKTLFRLDIQEIVKEEEMLPADRQLVLDDVRIRQGKTERNLDEKEITETDPDSENNDREFADHEDDEDEGGDEGEESE